jgi:nicotinamide-nucleotide amidase
VASDVVHDKAVIISTGDELMTGQLQDSNARWLSERLVELGILTVEHIAVGDDSTDLFEAIHRAARRAPLVVMSGGLGPTDGDLTREELCRATGDTLVLDPGLRAELEARFAKRGRALTARQERQAYRPSKATALPNELGTAPGLAARLGVDSPWKWSQVFCLPGPPSELRPMFEREVVPRLSPPPGRVVLTRLLHVIGLAEADCVDRLGELTRRDRTPLVGITASGGILTIRIRYEGGGAGGDSAGEDARHKALRRVDETERTIRGILGDHVLPTDAQGRSGVECLSASILADLGERSRTLAVVESCTGGMLGEMITAIPGSSAAFRGGYITYSNDLKVNLGVDAGAIARLGAVSPEVASQMALRGLERSGAHFCLALTGIAGPDGGTAAKPVGTVHIGLASREIGAGASAAGARHFVFSGDREDVRRRACVSAMAMLHFALRGCPAGEPRLLWEAPS